MRLGLSLVAADRGRPCGRARLGHPGGGSVRYVREGRWQVARTNSGSLHARTLADRTRVFRLRFNAHGGRRFMTLHERAECECGCGGGWNERTARTELGNIRARIRAGAWRPTPAPAPAPTNRRSPTFHEYASLWLQAKIDGVIGEKPIGPAAQSDYRWKRRFTCFRSSRATASRRSIANCASRSRVTSSPSPPGCARNRRRRRHPRPRGRRAFPLGPASLRGILNALASILDDAIEDELIDRNPPAANACASASPSRCGRSSRPASSSR